ncbi:MAG: zinc-binding dehydrogenase [Xanthomonadales bacterium]|nr:zinc-binding dehydrogenase [Xanthomonadales bacterium]
MQAVVFEQPGNPLDVLSVREVARPAPGPGQVLLRVAARPIQPADFLFIGGRYRISPGSPQVAGLEGLGTVVACGPDTSGFEAGERVAFRSPGTWADFAVATVSRIYRVPASIPDPVACQFALNPLTAWGLLAECDLPPGARILLTAGRSQVAGLLARLALQRGHDVSLLVRDRAGFAVLDARTLQPAGRQPSVAAALGSSRFHAILDAVGGSATVDLIEALEARGRLVSYGILDDGEVTLKTSQVLFRNMIWQGFGIDAWLDHASSAQLEHAQRELWNLLDAAPELLPVSGRFSLARVDEAIRMVEAGAQRGKVLLLG